MKVHGNDPIGSGSYQHIGDQLATDGNPGPVFTILPGITIIRHYHNDLISRSSAGCIDHEQQFHQVVGRGISALYKENEITPDTFQKYRLDLAITEFLDIDLARRAAVTFTNLFGQFFGAGTGEYFSRRIHG